MEFNTCEIGDQKNMRIIVLGYEGPARELVRLLSPHHDVTVVPGREDCELEAGVRARLVKSRAINHQVLLEAETDQAQAVFAFSDDRNVNLMMAITVRNEFGVSQVFALLQDSGNGPQQHTHDISVVRARDLNCEILLSQLIKNSKLGTRLRIMLKSAWSHFAGILPSLQVTQLASFFVFLGSFVVVANHGLEQGILQKNPTARFWMMAAVLVNGLYLYLTSWALELSEAFSRFRTRVQEKKTTKRYYWKDLIMRLLACILINLFPISGRAKSPIWFLLNLVSVPAVFALWDWMMKKPLRLVVRKVWWVDVFLVCSSGGLLLWCYAYIATESLPTGPAMTLAGLVVVQIVLTFVGFVTTFALPRVSFAVSPVRVQESHE